MTAAGALDDEAGVLQLADERMNVLVHSSEDRRRAAGSRYRPSRASTDGRRPSKRGSPSSGIGSHDAAFATN
jgi:hypothetical protein